MSVTPSSLKDDRDRKAAEQAAKKAKSEEEYKLFLRRKAVKDAADAESMLSGRLGDLIKEANDKGHLSITIEQDSNLFCKEIIKFGGETQWSHKFNIGFDLDEKYKATKILLSELLRAGFIVRHSVKEEGNMVYEFHGDGEYDVVDAPGTHPVYTLYISWLK